jgi:AcrR family transcriptional regulator
MTEKQRVSRKNDPQKTRDNIIDIATQEFAEHGLSGGRVDSIAEKTKTSKRMIYYYFGSKEGLYLAVLEKAYRKIRTLEADLALADLEPIEALRTIISSTFDHDEKNPDFVRLVSIENIHYAMHMKQSSAIAELNISIINTLAGIIERGLREGSIKRRIDPIDLHMLISAFCFFRVSNRHTFGTIYNRDLSDPSYYQRHKAMISDSVISYLTTSAV